MGLNINCKQATAFVEMKHAHALGLIDRFKLTYHLAMCKACAAYNRQSKQLDSLLQNIFQKPVETTTDTKNLEKKILDKLPNK